MNLFGKAKAAKTTPKDAIVKLREQLEVLDKRESYLQIKIDNEIKVARANASKNRRLALMALKRKKVYEEQITKIMGSRMTLEHQMMSIESANVNLETMEAMRQGAAAMKDVHGKMDIKKVDQVMDDIRDQMDLANEISDAISQPVAIGMEFDEDELNQELEELEQLELDEKLLDTTSASQININHAPAVPNTIPAIAQPPRPGRVAVLNDEDAELAELKASMAL